MLIGLSLSGCINDILWGNVKEKDVDYIIVSCVFKNEQDLEEIINSNLDNGIWKQEFLPEIKALIKRLTLKQPRLIKPDHYPLIIKEYWVNSEEDIIWNDEFWTQEKFKI
ncbi:hypothetical protein PCC7424_5009 [Gloeothece citriformis PCC 7424]|uniref:Uncharacterized protein n=1 Tax=Gloeothece citriformis (strain PCC 7424) TaxID=65393 RepID=B7KFN7_GLOC7|nr:hypothetical protein [Gloeothece citriformis]ACK73362.1 hypothetical protein PCC7424_5009 [Gloeothece citriformis PCC 7424]